jgi:hypothetical protein
MAWVTFALVVESCFSIPLSTAAVSTVLACGVVVDFAELDEFELPQPVTATAPAAKQATIAAPAPRRARPRTAAEISWLKALRRA